MHRILNVVFGISLLCLLFVAFPLILLCLMVDRILCKLDAECRHGLMIRAYIECPDCKVGI